MRLADGDVVERHLDVGDGCRLRLDRPLVLVQQRDGADQRQVLHVVAAGAGAVVEERQLPGVGIDHPQRPQEPLGVAVQLDDVRRARA